MDFRDKIKQVRRKYYDVLKEYFNVNSIILKMILNNIKISLSECDLNFRTAELYSFSDKNISKLYNKDTKKAIEELRTRAMCCIYTANAIEDVIEDNMAPSKQFVEFNNKLKVMIDELFDLAMESIKRSNICAKEQGLPLWLKEGDITIDNFKTAHKQHDINEIF